MLNRIKILSLLFITLLLCSAFSTHKSDTMNKSFKFENYKTADQARDDYIEEHVKSKARAVNFEPSEQELLSINQLREKANYKNDAITALLKLHPVGSKVKPLIETLEKAGAFNIKAPEYKDRLFYRYYENKGSMFREVLWRVLVETKNDAESISGIEVKRSGTLLFL